MPAGRGNACGAIQESLAPNDTGLHKISFIEDAQRLKSREVDTVKVASMPISAEGGISICLGLMALLGSGVIMVFPTQIWIGWSMVIASVVGLALLGLEYYELWNLKTIPVIGIAISAPALLTSLVWYFWTPPPNANVASKERTSEPPPIGALSYVSSELDFEIIEENRDIVGQIKVTIKNNTDRLIYFSAVTAGNVNGKAFDPNKVKFDGYAYPRQNAMLISNKISGLIPNQHDSVIHPAFLGIFEYELSYKYADETYFTRYSARGIKFELGRIPDRPQSGSEILRPTTVMFYNEIEK